MLTEEDLIITVIIIIVIVLTNSKITITCPDYLITLEY